MSMHRQESRTSGFRIAARQSLPSPLAVLFALLSLSGLVACGSPELTPEAAVRAVFDEAERAAEARELGNLRPLLADNYIDRHGNDKSAIVNLLRLHLLRNQKIHLVLRVKEVEVQAPNLATATIAAAMAGRPLAEDLTGIDADLLLLDLALTRLNGDWQVSQADWRRATPGDFL